MFFIVIDLSDKFLDSCIVDSATDVVARSKFDFTHDGFCSLSDQADAQYIADYIREHYKTIRPINIPDEKIRE